MCIHAGVLNVFWTHCECVCAQQLVCCFSGATEKKREVEKQQGKEEGYLMKPSLCDKESHQSPWCVTWPGLCHHRAPVVAEKYPPLLTHTPFPSPPAQREKEGERERETDRQGEVGGQSDRQKERVQTDAMWVCVIWNRFSANDLPYPHPSSPYLCTHPLPSISQTPTPHQSVASIIPSQGMLVCSSSSVPELYPFTSLTLPHSSPLVSCQSCGCETCNWVDSSHKNKDTVTWTCLLWERKKYSHEQAIAK